MQNSSVIMLRLQSWGKELGRGGGGGWHQTPLDAEVFISGVMLLYYYLLLVLL